MEASVLHPDPRLAAPAALISEPARAAMLTALLGGVALPAGELSALAGVTPQTGSEHLRRLLDGGLVVQQASGRHRYYALADERVARALEALQLLAPPAKVNSLKQHSAARKLAFARSCYDHLAGELALWLADYLVATGAVAPLEISRPGVLLDPQHPWLLELGVGRPQGGSRREQVRGCLDWTGRRPHLAGSLGADVLAALLEKGWLSRVRGGRQLKLTPGGSRHFDDFG